MRLQHLCAYWDRFLHIHTIITNVLNFISAKSLYFFSNITQETALTTRAWKSSLSLSTKWQIWRVSAPVSFLWNSIGRFPNVPSYLLVLSLDLELLENKNPPPSHMSRGLAPCL